MVINYPFCEYFKDLSSLSSCGQQVLMMKFLCIALLFVACVSFAFVEGRKDHKRARVEHVREARRERIGKHKMMREAHQASKANVGKTHINNDATAIQVGVTK